MSNIFTSSPQRPDQLWDRPTLLPSGYWGVLPLGAKRPRVKQTSIRRWVDVWMKEVCVKKISSGKNSLLRLIWRGPHRELRVQQFYRCVYIRCRGNVFAEPALCLTKHRDDFTLPLRRWDGLRCIASSINTDSAIETLVEGGGGRGKQKTWRSHKNIFILFSEWGK
jgi:hypothetical protein